MIKVKFRDFFNEKNVCYLGYGYVGCFFIWLFGTDDKNAIRNIVEAAYDRTVKELNSTH